MNRITILVKRANIKEWKKIASEEQPRETSGWSAAKQIAVAGTIAAAYLKLIGDAGSKLPTGNKFTAFLMKNPKLAAALGFGAMTAPIFFNRSILPSEMGNNFHMEPDKNNFVERNTSKPFTKISSAATAGLALTFGAPIATGVLSDYLQKKRMTDPEYQEGTVKSFIRKYKEPAQLLAAGAGLGLLTGRPIPTKLYNMGASGLKALEKAIPHAKMGSITDTALDTLIWPLAMGGPNLAHRLVGSVIDQTAFAGLKRLSNKRSKDKLS
jgi:hypothetical protein